MKKLLTLVLMTVFAFSMISCGGKGKDGGDKAATNATEVATNTAEATDTNAGPIEVKPTDPEVVKEAATKTKEKSANLATEESGQSVGLD